MQSFSNLTETLMNYAKPQTCMIPIPYQGTSLKISTCKTYIVYGTRCGHVVIYNQASNEVFADLTLSSHSLWNVAIAPDNSYILAGGVDSEIKYIQFPSLMIMPPLTGHTNEINHIIINKEGTLIYSCSDDGSVRLWTLSSYEMNTLYNHSRIVYALDLSDDNSLLISGDSSGCIKLYNTTTSTILRNMNVSQSVWCIKISPFNNYIVAGESGGLLTIFTIYGDIIKELDAHTDRLRCLDFDSSEKYFVSSGNDHLVKVWNIEGNTQEITFNYHTDWIKASVIDNENSTITSVSDDCFISIIRFPKDVGSQIVMSDIKVDQVIFFKETGHLYGINQERLLICELRSGDVINSIDLRKNGIFEYIKCEKSKNLIVFVCVDKIVVVDILSLKIRAYKNDIVSEKYEISDCFLIAYSDSKLLVWDTQKLDSNPHKIFSLRVASIYAYKKKIYTLCMHKLKQYSLKGLEWETKFKSDITKIKHLSRDILCVIAEHAIIYFKHTKLLTIYLEEPPHLILANEKEFYFIQEYQIQIFSLANFEKIKTVISHYSINSAVLFNDTLACIYLKIGVELFKINHKCFFSFDQENENENIRDIIQLKNLKKEEFHIFTVEPGHINILHLLAYYGLSQAFTKELKSGAPFTKMLEKFSPLHCAIMKKKYRVVDEILKNFDMKMMYSITDCLDELNFINSRYLHNVYKRISDTNTIRKSCIKSQVKYEEKYMERCLKDLFANIDKVQFFVSLLHVDNNKILASKFVLFIVDAENARIKWVVLFENILCLVSLGFLFCVGDLWLQAIIQICVNCPALLLSVKRIYVQQKHLIFFTENCVDLLRGLFSVGILGIYYYGLLGVWLYFRLFFSLVLIVRQFLILTYFSYMNRIVTSLGMVLENYFGVFIIEVYFILSLSLLLSYLNLQGQIITMIFSFLLQGLFSIVFLADFKLSNSFPVPLNCSLNNIKLALQCYSSPSFLVPSFKYSYKSYKAFPSPQKPIALNSLKSIEHKLILLKETLSCTSDLNELKASFTQLFSKFDSYLLTLSDL